MVNHNIIKVKISRIEISIERIKEKNTISFKEFKNNLDTQDVVLYNLQIAIQGCIDLAGHIVSDQGWPAPDTSAGLFDILKKHKIIPEQLTKNLRKMAGFRNLIIHEYANIDLEKVYNILHNDIRDIMLFLKYICVFAKL
jgi:uncharacterized protein YutE (UPF0331/DUF86 family)